MAIVEKVQKAKMKNQLKKELNGAIKSPEANIDKNLREINNETKKKLDKANMRLIHDLFFVRTL
jgi:BMFP domain-containing protein YqiC